MSKNIVICCDGTANEFARRDTTNVVKLFSTLVHDSRQTAYYRLGIGVMEPVGAFSLVSKWWTRPFGKAAAFGLNIEIQEIYSFITDVYERGDRLFLFGFSRGAYAVRVVASLLRILGVLRKESRHLIPYAVRTVSEMTSNPSGVALENFSAIFSAAPCTVHFVGLWDTVSAVGFLRSYFSIPYTANNPSIAIARHAVAIDERRARFRQVLWVNHPHHSMPNLKQVWFPGVHSDVGGGYPEDENGISKVSLGWMLREAADAGLLIHEEKCERVLGTIDGTHSPTNTDAMIHESLSGWWWLPELVPMPRYNYAKGRTVFRMNLGRKRTIPPASLVHVSAFRRYRDKLPVDAVCVE
jgi:uncharacterized protein (DUF2235 family)